jgi:hypothetical protein
MEDTASVYIHPIPPPLVTPSPAPEDAAHVAEAVHTRSAPQCLQGQQLIAGNAPSALLHRHSTNHVQHHAHTLTLRKGEEDTGYVVDQRQACAAAHPPL